MHRGDGVVWSIIIIVRMQVEGREIHPPADDDRIIDDGFSSEEELQHEEIHVEEVKPDEKEANHKEEVRFKIPPPP